MVKAKLAISR
uniref:Uncharacterized protein n=1 Tax=Anguilla anguilla TaxID=7936 RepID=A0A0E9T4P8_ANGAN